MSFRLRNKYGQENSENLVREMMLEWLEVKKEICLLKDLYTYKTVKWKKTDEVVEKVKVSYLFAYYFFVLN